MKTNRFFTLLLLAFLLSACAGRQAAVTPVPPGEKPPAEKEEVAMPAAEKPAAPPATVNSGGEQLLVVGRAEYVTIVPAGISLPARIDTGATTSSLHALNIKKFERDGKKWVRFQLLAPDGRKIRVERPLLRMIAVKRPGSSRQSRPVVTLEVRLGPLHTTSRFSLTDRGQFKYPVLIGRSLLKGVAVVDVSRKFVLSSGTGNEGEK